MPTNRRRLLKKAGLYGTGTVVGLAALPSRTPRVQAPNNDFPHPETLPELASDGATPIEEETTAFAVWHYKHERSGFRATAPINVVFTLDGTDSDIEDVMSVLDDIGWYRSPEEYTRYAWNYYEDRFEVQHATAAETLFGNVGRHHVRCWQFGNTVSMQAHEDSPGFPRHTIESYESTRTFIEQLYGVRGWSVASAELEFGNDQDPDHDGRVTVISP